VEKRPALIRYMCGVGTDAFREVVWFVAVPEQFVEKCWEDSHRPSSEPHSRSGSGRRFSLHANIHRPFSSAGAADPADPDFPLTLNTFQLLLGDPEAMPSQLGEIIPPACPGSSPGSSSQLDEPGKPQMGGVQEASESDARTTPADSSSRRQQRLVNNRTEDESSSGSGPIVSMQIVQSPQGGGTRKGGS